MRIWLAIPFMLPCAAIADEPPPVTSQNFYGCGSATGNGPCSSSSGFPLGVSGTVTLNPLCDGDTCLKRSSRVIQPCDGTPNCAINWTTSAENPMIVVLGAGGCITGPFKLFNHGQTILEIPANAEYPPGCRTPK